MKNNIQRKVLDAWNTDLPDIGRTRIINAVLARIMPIDFAAILTMNPLQGSRNHGDRMRMVAGDGGSYPPIPKISGGLNK